MQVCKRKCNSKKNTCKAQGKCNPNEKDRTLEKIMDPPSQKRDRKLKDMKKGENNVPNLRSKGKGRKKCIIMEMFIQCQIQQRLPVLGLGNQLESRSLNGHLLHRHRGQR